MAYCMYTAVFEKACRLVETIKRGVGGNREVVVIHPVETIHGIFCDTVCSIVPLLVYLLEIPTLGIIEAWSNIKESEQLERRTHRYIVRLSTT